MHVRWAVIGRLQAPDGLAVARARGRKGGRHPKMTPELIARAQRTYDSGEFSMAEIAAIFAITPNTLYRHIRAAAPGASRR